MLLLLYHGVRPSSDTSSPDIRKKHVPETLFRRQLQFLSRHFIPFTLSQTVQTLRAHRPLPARGICITFDDGYENNATTAAPLLKEVGWPATFFVTTGFIEGTTRLWVDRLETALAALPGPFISVTLGTASAGLPYQTPRERARADALIRQDLKHRSTADREQLLQRYEQYAGTTTQTHPLHRPMSWNQLRTLHQDGFEIGAHTITHPILAQCSLEEVARELTESKRAIERELQNPCDHVAYPNGQHGDWTAEIEDLVQRTGFQSCCTTEERWVRPDESLFRLPRVTVDTGSQWTKFLLTVTGIRFTLRRLF